MTTILTSPPAANGQIVFKYNIRERDSRRLLSSHLKQVVTRAYKFLYYGCTLHQEQSYLNEAVGLLSKELDGTLLVRRDHIQDSIYEFFELMEELRVYADSSANTRFHHRERKLNKAIRKFVTKMNGRTNIRLNETETEVLQALNLQGEVKVFYINLRRISTPFHAIFLGPNSPAVTAPKDLTDQQIRLALLNQLSPALVAAYEETGSLLTEAGSLANTAEDEYFIGQVSADYYFHIFENLQNVAKESADFVQKEAVVTESLKQFQIIQLGLNKIIENSIANSMSAMKSQTDFLRSKVIGPRGLELTPSEVELEVEASVEQSQRLREELYKKHVAPRIEQNRLDYEAKLTAMQEEYEADKKYLAVQNWQFKDQIKKLEAELAHRNSSQPDFTSPAPTSVIQNAVFNPPLYSQHPHPIQKRTQSEPAATIDVFPIVHTETIIESGTLTADRIYRP
jgi:hypothetical protein